ncbi:MAG: class I SAM-dependent methyltransferase [Thermoplasmata archaeon]|nr:class I SAM-dependent methyltransferase [Thermoplasmata archaeon]
MADAGASRTSESSPMYRDLAAYYDRIYTWKDYRAESNRVMALARRFGRTRGRRWLDVACGTGRHLEILRRRYDVTGVDLSRPMLREARKRLPGVRLVAGDMRSLDLHERFDVVSCLFSAIGYLRSEADLRRAFRTFERHLLPGGVLLVEPWIGPAEFRPGHVSLDVYEDESTKIARAGFSEREGPLSRITFDFLIGESGRGFRHLREVEELRLTSAARLRQLLGATGLVTTWVPPRPRIRGDRGWLVGVAAKGR